MIGYRTFCFFGWFWILVGVFYSHQLTITYGRNLPANVTEWIGELFVGFLLVSGSIMLGIGRVLKNCKK